MSDLLRSDDLTTSDRPRDPTPPTERERWRALREFSAWLDTPMLVLAFVWLALLILEFTWGEGGWFEVLGTAIWIIFVIDFVIELVLAPQKGKYLRGNWLTAVSLLIPALRIARIFRTVRVLRLVRTARGLRLIRVVSSMNRGMRALRTSLGRRGFGYVAALTLLMTFAGAAGMYAFEKDESGGLNSYGEALWWTAMVMTTMGSQYWPQSPEGRVLCVFLALYAFAVFGYVTASLATFFVGRDAEHASAELAGARQIAQLQADITALRDELRRLSRP